MKINVKWYKPIEMREDIKRDVEYLVNLDKIPDDKSGCYLFYNRHGKSISVLYIGQALRLRNRIEQQLDSVRLMKGIKKTVTGHKWIMYCIVETQQGQRMSKVLDLLEKNLIKRAVSEGHDLLNLQGSKIPYNEIHFNGNRISEKIFGRKMNVEK